MVWRSAAGRPVGGLGLDDDPIFLAAIGVGRDPPRAEQRLEGVGDVLDRDPEVAGAGGVDGDPELRLGLLIVGIEIDDSRIGGGSRQNPVAGPGELGIGRAGDDEADRLAAAAAADRRAHLGVAAHRGDLAEPAVDLLDDVLGGLLTLLPGFQEDDEIAAVEIVAVAEAARSPGDDRPDGALVDERKQLALRVEHVAVHLRVAGALGRADVGGEDSDILGRHQLRAKGREQRSGAGEEEPDDDERDQRPADHSVEPARIEAFEPAEAVVDPAREAAPLLIFEELRAEHRREAEGEKPRKGDGADHRRGELAEQQSGLAGDEHDRHEHGADDERGRDDGEADLAGPLEGGGERRLALLDPVIDVLEHDDGVVDDNSDREHHGEQGQQVDRESEQPQHREAGEQAERNGDGGDQGRSPVAQEQVDDENDEHGRFGERHPDLFDGPADEQALVGADHDVHAFGERGLQLLGRLLGRVGNGQRVRARLPDDAEADRFLAVETESGIGILRSLLDPGDVAQADEIAVRAATDDELGELPGVLERPVDPEGDVLLRRIRGGRREARHSGAAERSRDRRG